MEKSVVKHFRGCKSGEKVRGKVNPLKSFDISQNREKVSGQDDVTARTNEMLNN